MRTMERQNCQVDYYRGKQRNDHCHMGTGIFQVIAALDGAAGGECHRQTHARGIAGEEGKVGTGRTQHGPEGSGFRQPHADGKGEDGDHHADKGGKRHFDALDKDKVNGGQQREDQRDCHGGGADLMDLGQKFLMVFLPGRRVLWSASCFPYFPYCFPPYAMSMETIWATVMPQSMAMVMRQSMRPFVPVFATRLIMRITTAAAVRKGHPVLMGEAR